jgi:hypothetical protein
MSIKYTNNFKFKFPLQRVIPIYEHVSDGNHLGQFVKKDYKDDIEYDIMTIDKHNLLHMKHTGLLINEHYIKDNICAEYQCQYSILVPFDTLSSNIKKIIIIFYTIYNNKIYFGLCDNNDDVWGYVYVSTDESNKDRDSTSKYLLDKIYGAFDNELVEKDIIDRYQYQYLNTDMPYDFMFCSIASTTFFKYYPRKSVREISVSTTETYKFKSVTIDSFSRESDNLGHIYTYIYASIIEYNEAEKIRTT